MIKVTALTSGKNDPASRYRVRQFVGPLRGHGVEVAEHYPPIGKYRLKHAPPLGLLARLPGLLAARSSDVTWFSRELVAGRSTLERFAGRRRVFDVDDAIWLERKNPFSEEIVRHCHGVTAGNRFLADHYANLGARVWVVPTCVDTDALRPAPRREKSKWTVGWIGTWWNMRYVRAVEEPLADFLARHGDAELLIVCDGKPSFGKIPAGRWRFARWSAEREVALVQEMDAGIMPLADTDWERGKCAFKMLQYMATGLPVVVSPVGANREVLGKGEVGFAATDAGDWHTALVRLYEDREGASRMGAEGRRVVEEHYSVRRAAPLLAGIFREVVNT